MSKGQLIWDLKNLPLTEMIGPFDPNFKNYDQSLMIDDKGHVYLKNILPSDVLYSSQNYTYRTESSPKSQRMIQEYLNFFNQSTHDIDVNCIIDIGGNDLTIAKQLVAPSNSCFVIDPVCSDIDGEVIDNIKVIGKKIEDVDLNEIKPDVISCRHTIEHIHDPVNFISQLFKQCPDHCRYVFELPDFDCLMEGMRFDAVFHQHLHYFSLDTLTNLIINCGGEVIDYYYNHRGSCGGALFLVFQKATKNQNLQVIDVEQKANLIRSKISSFEILMNELSNKIHELPKPVYGFGAGLMLATYAYHLKTDFSFLEALLDDDLDKHGKGYRNLPLSIQHPTKINVPENSSFIVTSLENIRPIYKRIEEFNPRRILIPNIS